MLGLVVVMFDDLFQVHSLNSRLNHSHRRRRMASVPRGASKRFVGLSGVGSGRRGPGSQLGHHLIDALARPCPLAILGKRQLGAENLHATKKLF